MLAKALRGGGSGHIGDTGQLYWDHIQQLRSIRVCKLVKDGKIKQAPRSKGADNCAGHVALENCYLFKHISMQQTKGPSDNWLEEMKMYHTRARLGQRTLLTSNYFGLQYRCY